MGSIEATKFVINANGKKVATKDSKWRARWRSPGNQSREQTFDRKVDAERHLTSIEHSKLTGSYVDPRAGRVTFKSFAEEWRKVQVHSDGTSTSVDQHLRLHIYPMIGDRPIGAIRPSEGDVPRRGVDR